MPKNFATTNQDIKRYKTRPSKAVWQMFCSIC